MKKTKKMSLFLNKSKSVLSIQNNYGENNKKEIYFKGWTELKDEREMMDYNVSIAADPTKMKQILAGSVARSKLRYLTVELFGDFSPLLFGTLDFYISLVMFTFAFWMRIYVHFLAGYLYLQSLRTPIVDFKLKILIIEFKYSSTAISTGSEVGLVAIGPIANIVVFSFFVIFGALFYRYAKFLPDTFSKFFAAFGVATVVDPLLVLLVDLGYHNYACASTYSNCHNNYLSSHCPCVNGDFIKLWNRMKKEESSGITGLFIMLMLYTGTFVISLLILYEYLVHIHRDGRILDLWRRHNAPNEEFFIPEDFEISLEELTFICNKATTSFLPNQNVIKRKISVINGVENDPEDENFSQEFTRFVIYDVEKNGNTIIYRQFMRNSCGMILEIFQDVNLKNVKKDLLLLSLKNNVKSNVGNKIIENNVNIENNNFEDNIAKNTVNKIVENNNTENNNNVENKNDKYNDETKTKKNETIKNEIKNETNSNETINNEIKNEIKNELDLSITLKNLNKTITKNERNSISSHTLQNKLKRNSLPHQSNESSLRSSNKVHINNNIEND